MQSDTKLRLSINQSEANQRLDRFLRKYFKTHSEVTLGDIFSRIRKGSIKVNGKKSKENYRVLQGDIIERDSKIHTNKKASQVTRAKKHKIKDLSLQKIKPHIIFEDENRLVWNKPARLVMHPGNKHTHDITLHDMMITYLSLTDQLKQSSSFTPSFCFRLDKDTSGVCISAKTYPALQYLNEQIRERKTKKQYHLVSSFNTSIPRFPLVCSEPLFVGYSRRTGKAETFVNQERGKHAKTTFERDTKSKTINRGESTIMLLKATIETGRMHQIRVHAAHHGFPILGDLTYGHPAANRLAKKQRGVIRQLLHASSYGFFDTFTHKRVSFSAPLPEEFTQFSSGEKKSSQSQ